MTTGDCFRRGEAAAMKCFLFVLFASLEAGVAYSPPRSQKAKLQGGCRRRRRGEARKPDSLRYLSKCISLEVSENVMGNCKQLLSLVLLTEQHLE